jgi:Nucleotidyl transferase AbiEii toxin, Type IV TA system
VISALTPLQRDLAERFFALDQRFILTGGGALAGFILGHRETQDLDLFARDRILDDGARSLREAAAALGATVTARPLDLAGHRLEDALPLAQRKDGGLTPAQLAWVVSQIQIGDDARIPGGVGVTELRRFVVELQRRLGALSAPAR